MKESTEIIAALENAPARVILPGLEGSAPAFVLSGLAGAGKKKILAITADQESAEELAGELNFFASGSSAALLFPSWGNPPFAPLSPHPDISGRRLDTLFLIFTGMAQITVAPLQAVMQRVIPRRFFNDSSCYLVSNEEFDRDELLARLVRTGYSNVPLVEDRGSFAARGGIVDAWPPNMLSPVRIEFAGDTVESIRSFDPLTQRSLNRMDELVLVPSREILLAEDFPETVASRLKERCDELEINAARRRGILDDLRNGVYFNGAEYLQPLLHPGLETLFDYASDAVLALVNPEGIRYAASRFRQELAEGEERARKEKIFHMPPGEMFLEEDEFERLISGRSRLEMGGLSVAESAAARTISIPCRGNSELRVSVSKESTHALLPLAGKIRERLDSGFRVMIVCHQHSQGERLKELLAPYRLRCVISEERFAPLLYGEASACGFTDGAVHILCGEISRGFLLPDSGILLIAEEELFGKRVRRHGVSEVRKKQILSSLAELKPGDFMVHADHGIGLYRGLQHLSIGGVGGDFLLLEYAGTDKLYLPVDRLGLVQRYAGPDGATPSPDRLGGTGWEKSRGRAAKAIEELAGELIEIYAKREMSEGFAFSPPDEMYREFEASFAWEETPDQMQAINDVLADMQRPRPMDRLVCGDVGYGKTEVALRGAFKAALDGKQVGVLTPTTILAQQHYETFSERLRDYPLTVDVISRFRPAREQKAILERLKKGEIDILIGTHRLLQKDVAFKDLGLLIIDEEQRFGVRDKERLKSFRALVDVMTLTATPIPRTLYMSMMGIRDLSIIDTPPVDRLAIRTFVARFSEELVGEAVMREIRRGGQVFFVHNRVSTIAKRAAEIASIVPEAKIAVAHGQMNEQELEKLMLGFMHGETDVLVCTTIIESGLDIPNANTLIVDRADTFGLSQLYQLRGRIGRSSRRGYAYLLIPVEGSITPEARERLKILQDISELGAGFRIATHDMEIRGAGDMLGSRQSGTVSEIGFELYNQMLEETICRLKGEEMTERVEPEINLKVPAFIPESYVADMNQRLVIYKKLTQAENDDDIMDVQSEITDRFGSYPQAVVYLFEIMRLRVMLKRLLVMRIDFDGKELALSFHPRTPASVDAIIGMVEKEPGRYRFTSDYQLTCRVGGNDFDGILAAAREILNRLAPWR